MHPSITSPVIWFVLSSTGPSIFSLVMAIFLSLVNVKGLFSLQTNYRCHNRPQPINYKVTDGEEDFNHSVHEEL